MTVNNLFAHVRLANVKVVSVALVLENPESRCTAKLILNGSLDLSGSWQGVLFFFFFFLILLFFLLSLLDFYFVYFRCLDRRFVSHSTHNS